MTLLSKKLEEIRAKVTQAHHDEHQLLVELNARLEKQDAHLIDELQAVLQGQSQRRSEIHRLLLVLAGRTGGLPPPAISAPEPQALDEVRTGPMPAVLERERERQAAITKPANGHYPNSRAH